MDQRLCTVCGKPVRRDNTVGVCSRTKTCRVKRQQLYMQEPGRTDSKKTYDKQRRQDNKERLSAYHAAWRRANVKGIAVASARNRAARKGWEFDLTVEELPDIPEVCPVLGIPLKQSQQGRQQDGSPSLDRIDSSRGYTLDNVHWISFKANRIKNDATPAELRAVADYFERLANAKKGAKVLV